MWTRKLNCWPCPARIGNDCCPPRLAHARLRQLRCQPICQVAHRIGKYVGSQSDPTATTQPSMCPDRAFCGAQVCPCHRARLAQYYYRAAFYKRVCGLSHMRCQRRPFWRLGVARRADTHLPPGPLQRMPDPALVCGLLLPHNTLRSSTDGVALSAAESFRLNGLHIWGTHVAIACQHSHSAAHTQVTRTHARCIVVYDHGLCPSLQQSPNDVHRLPLILLLPAVDAARSPDIAAAGVPAASVSTTNRFQIPWGAIATPIAVYGQGALPSTSRAAGNADILTATVPPQAIILRALIPTVGPYRCIQVVFCVYLIISHLDGYMTYVYSMVPRLPPSTPTMTSLPLPLPTTTDDITSPRHHVVLSSHH